MQKKYYFLSFQSIRKHNSFLILFGFVLLSFVSNGQQNVNQYTEISGAELESTIYQNHQSGRSGYHGLINNVSFTVEDYALLKTHFDDVTNLLKDQFETEEFYLNDEENSLVVFYDKSKAGTKEFIKILKEVLYTHHILLVDFSERTMLKN